MRTSPLHLFNRVIGILDRFPFGTWFSSASGTRCTRFSTLSPRAMRHNGYVVFVLAFSWRDYCVTKEVVAFFIPQITDSGLIIFFLVTGFVLLSRQPIRRFKGRQLVVIQ